MSVLLALRLGEPQQGDKREKTKGHHRQSKENNSSSIKLVVEHFRLALLCSLWLALLQHYSIDIKMPKIAREYVECDRK